MYTITIGKCRGTGTQWAGMADAIPIISFVWQAWGFATPIFLQRAPTLLQNGHFRLYIVLKLCCATPLDRSD